MQSVVAPSVAVSRTTYPALMTSLYNGVVVMFTEPNKGVVVGHAPRPTGKSIRPGPAKPIGYASASWVNYKFVPFEGTITLSN